MPPRKYFVLGIETDYETYRKFTYESLWTIDGDILKGIPCSLWNLENYYSTESHAQDHPVEATNARKLRDGDRNMSAENRAICTAVAAASYNAKDGSRELEIFDTAVSTLDYGLDRNAEHAARMAAHVPAWMDGYKAKMDNLPVIPEEMAPTPKADSSEGGNE